MKTIAFLSLNPIRFVPYAYGLLRAHVEESPLLKEHYRWQEPVTEPASIEEICRLVGKPDILCASCYVWNHNHHAEIARRIKARHPGCRVVFGGPHVPEKSAPYLAQHPQVDVLVHGEGELPLAGLLTEWLKPQPVLDRVSGISYRQNCRVVRVPGTPQLPRHLPVPSPYLKGYFESFLSDGRPNKIALWETNRGCPYACTFCDWGVRSMNKLRLHDLQKLAQEVEYMAARQVEDIYLTDCNFGILPRDLEIAELLVASKRRRGYPKRVRIQFAKKSNKTVFAISRLLHENDMLWGTTLSMQSVEPRVLKAINREFLGLEHYRRLKERYARDNIPTYTELILGLPLETRESFIGGIGKLLRIGIHDDIRVFELTLLPNAPLAQPAARERYGLVTQVRPLRLGGPGGVREEVEIVFATSTMPSGDWAYCLLFGEALQALHNGGYTRFLARFLHEQRLLGYEDFYDGLLSELLSSTGNRGKPFRRVASLIQQFIQERDMPQISRVLSQPDMMELLRRYNPRRTGWPMWTYLWVALCDQAEAFYSGLSRFLETMGIAHDAVLEDLLRYQQEIMLAPDYDPGRGKVVEYDHDWFGYFFKGLSLERKPCKLRYTDTHMGPSHRFELRKDDLRAFTRAAIGISYPYTKFRHFFHQPDRAQEL